MNMQKWNRFNALGLLWKWKIKRKNGYWDVILDSRVSTLNFSVVGAYDEARLLVDAHIQIMGFCQSFYEYEMFLRDKMGKNFTVNHDTIMR